MTFAEPYQHFIDRKDLNNDEISPKEIFLIIDQHSHIDKMRLVFVEERSKIWTHLLLIDKADRIEPAK